MDWITVLRILLAAGIVLLLPGAALLAWLRRDSAGAPRRDPVAWLAEAAALSCALTALVGLWLFVAGLRLGAAAVVGVYAACLLAWILAQTKHGIRWPTRRAWLAGFFTLALLCAFTAWRLYQARSLSLPAWTDSVQHVLVVRKIFEYGGVPADLTPYLAVPFYYHYGFHLIAALLAFWSGLAPDRTVLWFGQLINALVALSAYRAALTFQERDTHRPRRFPVGPLLVALLVEFVFQMPAYYLTWGRYTLLTGLILLGPALAAVMDMWHDPRGVSTWLRLALLVAGAALVHYFVLLLIGLFFGVMGLFWIARSVRAFLRRAPLDWALLLRLVSAALAGLLLALPWILRVYVYGRQDATLQVVSPLDQTEALAKGAADYLQYLVYLLGPRRNQILLALSGAGLLFALRRVSLRILAVWTFFLILLTLPWGLRLGPFRPDHFAIVLFFPAALLFSALLVDGAAALGKVSRPWAGGASLALLSGMLVLWGARETRDILNASTVFVTPADVAALNWINLHTPATARFYINSAPWQANIYRGLDGGYWLLPYTGRASLVPPIPYVYGTPEFIAQIDGWAARTGKIKTCSTEFWALSREAHLSYVYLRQGTGSLQPAALLGCAGARLVYHQDGVYIFAINPPG